jgi:pyridoxal phosphate enzyme (YggS family)
MGEDVVSPEEASRRLSSILERIREAERRASRAPGEVRLLAVSKTFGSEAVHNYILAGQRDFGESYIQEAREKIPLVKGEAEWHFIGHLQSNKARYAAQLFSHVHALDSLELASELNRRLLPLNKKMACYIQINVSQEASKSGIEASELPGFLEALKPFEAIVPAGLMTMPPYDPNPEVSRPYFRDLRQLRDKHAPGLRGLSMGMSGDFEVAIEEGATIVRVGTILFGNRG